MKRKIIIGLSLIILVIVAFYFVHFYRLSRGVIKDANRMENYKIPKKFKINDSITVITDTTELN